jgi:hypothetical protein
MFTKVGLGVLLSHMSTYSKGSTDVNPLHNLSKFQNSSSVLTSEENIALYGVADCLAMGVGPSTGVAAHFSPLYWTPDHPASGVGPSVGGSMDCSPLY